MRSFKSIYFYLFAFTGIMLASCSESELTDDYAKTKLSLSINMAETKASEGERNDLPAERYINDVTVFLFTQDGTLIERPNSFLLGTDGDATRTVIASLTADYSTYTNVEVVVLTNLKARNINIPEIINTKNEMYSSLVYDYKTRDDWQMTENPKQYIPMSGRANISITPETTNSGSIPVYRAIARVDVLFNEGEGFDHFTPETIAVTRYNNKGYCASDDGRIHAYSSQATNEIHLFRPDPAEQIYRIYLPEFENSEEQPAQIKVTGKLKPTGSTDETTVNKTYCINFRFKDNEHSDIVRNNIYRFLITEINNEIDVTTGIEYEVETWGNVTVNIPGFE